MAKNNSKDPVLDIPEEFREEDELKQIKNSGDVDKLRKLLNDDEVVIRLVMCTVSGREAVLAATNQRIIFCDKLFIGSDIMYFAYREIAAVIYDPELVTHRLTLAHFNGALTVEGIDLKHGKHFIEFVQDQIGGDYVAVGKNGRALEYRGDDIMTLEEMPSMHNGNSSKS